ncbi:hypothetical protein ACOSQ4_015578 [Xanthoceras sorbifolium]
MASLSPFPANMHRSASTSRTSDEFLVNLLPAAAAMNSSPVKASASHDLPIYSPISDATKKELALHHKSMGENAIHLIPLLLIFCGFILWLFSHPASTRNKEEVRVFIVTAWLLWRRRNPVVHRLEIPVEDNVWGRAKQYVQNFDKSCDNGGTVYQTAA